MIPKKLLKILFWERQIIMFIVLKIISGFNQGNFWPMCPRGSMPKGGGNGAEKGGVVEYMVLNIKDGGEYGQGI